MVEVKFILAILVALGLAVGASAASNIQEIVFDVDVIGFTDTTTPADEVVADCAEKDGVLGFEAKFWTGEVPASPILCLTLVQ